MKRKREKCSKGLRHFSMKVCEKVKNKTVTTYNEVKLLLFHFKYIFNKEGPGYIINIYK